MFLFILKSLIIFGKFNYNVMKKILSFIFVSFALVAIAFGQNSTGGTNYYSSLLGKSIFGSGSGGTALVYVDMAHSNDSIVSTLTSCGYNVVVASSWSNFNTRLAAGHIILAVAFAQNHSAYTYGFSTSIAKNYIDNGGRMIFATWTASDAPILSMLEASLTGNSNLSTITVTDPTLAAGLTTNPFTISNISWGIYSLGLNAIGNGEVLATFENGDGAIVSGNNGNTLVLGYLSDTPPTALRKNIFSGVIASAETGTPVPVPYVWIALAFVLIAGSIVFAKRKVIFS
jgi:hypothetical protein